MKLHFPWNEIEKAMEEVRTASAPRPLYGEETGKGLWLVGDHGVYFMPNTTDGIHHKARQKDEKMLAVYAKECDPNKLDFDTWWNNKGASFGGDDGVEFFALAEIEKFGTEKPKYLVAEFTPEQKFTTLAKINPLKSLLAVRRETPHTAAKSSALTTTSC